MDGWTRFRGRRQWYSRTSRYQVDGDAKTFPQKETDPSYLISPYALTKLAKEYYARIFSVNYGLETVGLRYFNVFGPKQSLDDEYAVVIPKFITCMLNDEQPPIHGDGKQSRDFAYIENVVDANMLAATKPGIKCEVLKGSALKGTGLPVVRERILEAKRRQNL